MYKTNLILFVIILFYSVQGKAQQKDFVYYDSLTYKLYVDKDFKQLLKVGDEALNSGLDYYYLRMRIGIAAYNLKRYRLASVHFEKASSFSDNDIIQEYLYYSSLWGGEQQRAKGVADRMSEALKQRLGIAGRGVTDVSVDMALLNQAEDFPDDFEFPSGEDGTQIVPTQFFNMSFGLSHDLGSKAKLTHSFTYLHRSSDKYSWYDGQDYYDTGFIQTSISTILGLQYL